MYQLIALDLDGTLLKNDNTISPYTKTVLAKCRQAGAVVTISTGRMYASALPFAQMLALDDIPLITCHGALIQYTDGRLFKHFPLGDQLAVEISQLLAPYHPHLRLYAQDKLYMSDFDPPALAYAKHIAITPNRLPDDIRGLNPTKMAVVDDSVKINQYMTLLDEHYGDTIYMTKVSEGFLEISHPSGTKGHALALLAEHYHIDAKDVIAFGDSYNDLPMLHFAGHAVAMANGAQAVLEAADAICPSNEDDGVGHYLAQFLS